MIPLTSQDLFNILFVGGEKYQQSQQLGSDRIILDDVCNKFHALCHKVFIVGVLGPRAGQVFRVLHGDPWQVRVFLRLEHLVPKAQHAVCDVRIGEESLLVVTSVRKALLESNDEAGQGGRYLVGMVCQEERPRTKPAT